jgi:hypothetical protein
VALRRKDTIGCAKDMIERLGKFRRPDFATDLSFAQDRGLVLSRQRVVNKCSHANARKGLLLYDRYAWSGAVLQDFLSTHPNVFTLPASDVGFQSPSLTVNWATSLSFECPF